MDSIPNGQKVTVLGKVVRVDNPMEVHKSWEKITKQDCILKDCTSACCIVL